MVEAPRPKRRGAAIRNGALLLTLALASTGAAHAQNDTIFLVSEASPAILTVHLSFNGMAYQAVPMAYPPEPYTITGNVTYAGPATDMSGLDASGALLLMESDGTTPIHQMAGDAANAGAVALMVYGSGGPGTYTRDTGSLQYRPPLPVVWVQDGPLMRLDAETNPGATAFVSFGRGGFQVLDAVEDVETITVAQGTYAVTAGRDGVQVIDITDPGSPAAIASIYDGKDGFQGLAGASTVRAATISGVTYVVVAGDGEVQIMDFTDPYRPAPVSSMYDDRGGFQGLAGASDIEIVEVSGYTYCIITSYDDDAVQIIDVTDPSNPLPASVMYDEEDGFEGLAGASGVDTAVIDGRLYAAVAGYDDDAVQIIDMVNPYRPIPISYIHDRAGMKLDGASDIEITATDEDVYAIVTSYHDNAIQIINITTPFMPLAEEDIVDGDGRFDTLEGAWDIEIAEISGTTFGMVTAYGDDGMQVINLNNPALPRAVSNIPDENDDDEEFEVYGPRGVDVVFVGGIAYMVVAGHIDDTIHILDINRPASYKQVGKAANDDDVDIALDGNGGVEILEISGDRHILVSSRHHDAVQITNATDPRLPVPAGTIVDEEDEIEEMDGADDIEVVTISDRTYMVVAAYEDDGVEIIDITNPAQPETINSLSDGEDGFEALAGARGIDTGMIAGRLYGVVASHKDHAIQIIDLVNPVFPLPIASIFHNQEYVRDEDVGREDTVKVRALEGAWDVEIVNVGGRVYCLVSGSGYDTVQIIDITNPAQPWPLDALYDDVSGYVALGGAGDIETVRIHGKTYALVAGKWDGAVQIIDITDPESPRPAGHARDNRDGFVALGGASDMEVFATYGRLYAAVASSLDDAIQVIDITDPESPKPAGYAFDGTNGLELNGATDIDVFLVSGRAYAAVYSAVEDSVQIVAIRPR